MMRRTNTADTGRAALRGARRIALMIVLVTVGVLAATVLHLQDAAASPSFSATASTLLAVGLFASTSSIPWPVPRSDLQTVGVAVTVGVLAKAAVIGGVMALVLREPAFLVLGPVMAQIDPLSVVALRESSSLSVRGRAVLAAWSSFDDPVTALLVVLLGGLAATSGPATGPLAGPAAGLVSNLVGNLLLAAAAGVAWMALSAIRARFVARRHEWVWTVLCVLVLLALGALAVHYFLMLGLAAAGLFFRPPISGLLTRLTGLAFAAAAVLLGIVLAAGASPLPGLVLGTVAFGAQAAAGSLITRRMPGDRLGLALSQQSGITAVILALLLEPSTPGTVSVVAPAILVVNVWHLLTNAVVDHRRARRALGSDGRPIGPRGAQPSDAMPRRTSLPSS